MTKKQENEDLENYDYYDDDSEDELAEIQGWN